MKRLFAESCSWEEERKKRTGARRNVQLTGVLFTHPFLFFFIGNSRNKREAKM